jgi:hypothetical protein
VSAAPTGHYRASIAIGLNLVVCYHKCRVERCLKSYIRRLDTKAQWHHHRPLEFDFHERCPITVKLEVSGLCLCTSSNVFTHAGCDLVSMSELSLKPKQHCRDRRDVNRAIIFAEPGSASICKTSLLLVRKYFDGRYRNVSSFAARAMSIRPSSSETAR